MTPANPDALAEALARELARLDGWQDPDALWTDNIGIIARGGEGSPAYLDYVEDAGKLIAGPLAPILAAKEAAEARAAQLQAEVEALKGALKVFADMDAMDPPEGVPLNEWLPAVTGARAVLRSPHTPASGALKIEEADRDA